MKALKALRRSQPFNAIATSALRLSCRTVGIAPGFLARKMRRIGSVEDRLPGNRVLRLWTEDDDLIPNEVFWYGWDNFESETTPLFFELATHARVTLDLGAHVGLFALLAAHANPSGRVFAFEPNLPTFERLQRNVALNGLKNVECVPSAVSDHEGEADFFFNTAIALAAESSLRRASTEAAHWSAPQGEIKSRKVAVTTVDAHLRRAGVSGVDLVKIDTEGTEPAVLRGMIETLRRDHPAIVCEVMKGFDTEPGLHEILRPLGYRYYLLTEDGPVLRDTIDGQPDGHFEWRNYLFATASPETVAAWWRDARALVG